MRNMLIDANILLEVLLEQNKAVECKDILKKIKEGTKSATISTFTIDSIILIMERNEMGVNELSIFLNSLLNYKGLEIYQTTIEDRLNALDLIQEFQLDYEDSITLQSALSNEIEEILSFDKHFDSVKSIKRIEPSENL